MNTNPIGVFDSGVGGLTCLKELCRLMPNESFVYLGDTARVPYGTKSRDTIACYARQDIRFLEQHNVKMIIVACGTVSSVMGSVDIFEGSSVPLYSGVIQHAVVSALSATRNNKIGVIGTPATIASGSYTTALRELSEDVISVTAKACPLFVPLVENGYTDINNKVTRLVAEEYLEVMKKNGVDTLIMGCTHYPLLADIVGDIMGDSVTLISPGAEAAKYAAKALSESDMLCGSDNKGSCKLFCTDSEELFSENATAFLGSGLSFDIAKCVLPTEE